MKLSPYNLEQTTTQLTTRNVNVLKSITLLSAQWIDKKFSLQVYASDINQEKWDKRVKLVSLTTH